MDSGIVSTYYSVDEAIENGAAPIPLSYDRTSDIQCVIDIMDHFLACEVSSTHLLRLSVGIPNSSLMVTSRPLKLAHFSAGNMA